MTQSDYNKLLDCPRCGALGAIYLLKIAGQKIIVKQRCPVHGGRSYKIPLMQKDQFIPHIRGAIFRCYKCGQEAPIDHVKVSGPWTLIKCSCRTHGKKLPYQKIWSAVYNEISSNAFTEPHPEQPQPEQPHPEQPQPTPSEEKKFCPSCGTELEEIGKFCGTCGAEVE